MLALLFGLLVSAPDKQAPLSPSPETNETQRVDDFIHVEHSRINCAGQTTVNETEFGIISTESADAHCLVDPDCALYVRQAKGASPVEGPTMYMCNEMVYKNFPANIHKDPDTLVGLKVLSLMQAIPSSDVFDIRPNTLHICNISQTAPLNNLRDLPAICGIPECTALTMSLVAAVEQKAPKIVICKTPKGTETRREGTFSLIKRNVPLLKPTVVPLRAPCGVQGPVCPDDYNPFFREGEVADERILAAKKALTLAPNYPSAAASTPPPQ